MRLLDIRHGVKFDKRTALDVDSIVIVDVINETDYRGYRIYKLNIMWRDRTIDMVEEHYFPSEGCRDNVYLDILRASHASVIETPSK